MSASAFSSTIGAPQRANLLSFSTGLSQSAKDALRSEFETRCDEAIATPDIPIGVVAIRVLTALIERSRETTFNGLVRELTDGADVLKSMAKSLSINAACDLFCKYVSRTAASFDNFAQGKLALIERGTRFAQIAKESREKISQFGDRFIHEGKVILTHGRSRVVASVLKKAAGELTAERKKFTVIVTEGRPSGAGHHVARDLRAAGISCEVILDSAVGHVMERVDLVLVGAEGVVENGGIVNLIGTYQIAMVAKALKRPLYVAAESFKFVRLFPLQQSDVPNTALSIQASEVEIHDKVESSKAACDYTNPEYITLLFTDLGILTPAAISDELIKLYF